MIFNNFCCLLPFLSLGRDEDSKKKMISLKSATKPQNPTQFSIFKELLALFQLDHILREYYPCGALKFFT